MEHVAFEEIVECIPQARRSIVDLDTVFCRPFSPEFTWNYPCFRTIIRLSLEIIPGFFTKYSRFRWNYPGFSSNYPCFANYPGIGQLSAFHNKLSDPSDEIILRSFEIIHVSFEIIRKWFPQTIMEVIKPDGNGQEKSQSGWKTGFETTEMKFNRVFLMKNARHGRRHKWVWDPSSRVWEARSRVFRWSTPGSRSHRSRYENGGEWPY